MYYTAMVDELTNLYGESARIVNEGTAVFVTIEGCNGFKMFEDYETALNWLYRRGFRY